MHVLVIIDPLASLNLATETSLLLIEEMQRRGHTASIAHLTDLALSELGAHVRARSISVDLSREPFFDLGSASERPFRGFDLVLMRKDPPVDADYVAATYVLERAARDVPVINDPVSLRTVNEKLLPLSFPDFSPPTLLSKDASRLAAFAAAHDRVVLKPLDDCSGRGIEVINGETAIHSVTAYLARHGGRYVLAQRYIPGVVAGDKRIFLLAGAPIGAVNRVPKSAAHLANIHQGASVEATTITPREHAIIAAVRPVLVRQRLWMAGIDVIDGYLTEINVTSPSAARQINAVSGAHVEIPLVDFLERAARGGRS